MPSSSSMHSLSTLPRPPSLSAQPSDSTSHGHLIISNNDSHPPPKQLPARPLYPRSMTSVPSGYTSRHGKLHRRSDSGSSLLSSTSATMSLGAFQDHQGALQSSASQKLKPYLRKMSLRDDDEEQGRIDLSRPSCENPRHVSDVTFNPVARRTSHRRTTSLSSPLSSQPGAIRTSKSFIQPTRRTSQPYSPPMIFSNPPHANYEDEREESTDIVTEDVHRPSIERWRSRRTVSSTSGPYASSGQPLHNSSAASLIKAANASQSNLSERSASSQGGPEMRVARSRRNTGMSIDLPSSRTSFDRAVSFLSRTSEPEDPAARAANIRALRRAFEEKEAAKERKLEMKRRDKGSTNTHRRSQDVNYSEKMAGTEYLRHNSTPDVSLPIQGRQSGGAAEEYRVKTEVSKTKQAKGFWVRFQAWTKTRLLSCY